MRRTVVATLVLLLFLLLGSVLLDRPSKPRLAPDKITSQELAPAEAEAFIKEFAATHPTFARAQKRSSDFWRKKGRAPLPQRVVQFRYRTPTRNVHSLVGRFLDQVFPGLRAQTYSDGDGTIILSPWQSDDSVWDGNWYAWFNGFNGEISFDAEVTADEYADVNWTANEYYNWSSGGGGGCSVNPNECDRPGGLTSSNFRMRPFAETVRRTVWPTVLAVCTCDVFYQGRLGNCLLRGALDRARQACGMALIGCRRAGPAYFACVGEMCSGAVYVGFFLELWDFVALQC